MQKSSTTLDFVQLVRGAHLWLLDFLLEAPTPAPSPAALIPPTALRLGLQGQAEVILALSPSRFKYVLVNMSTGSVQDETLWSDPIRTRRREWGDLGWGERVGRGGPGPQGNLGKQTQAVTLKTLPRHRQAAGLSGKCILK